jgi:hypothetical protein
MLNFGDALYALKNGSKVCRTGWNGKGMYLFLVLIWGCERPIETKNMGEYPFIAMKTADNQIVPWLASQTDILAEDWMVA